MYNGIGLQTARGSGTNGYVQRNLSSVRSNKPKHATNSDETLSKFESEYVREPNLEILEHYRKREIEVRCVMLEEKLIDEG